MRIAYIIGDRGIPVFGNKGASVHVREMVNAFTALGHQVTLFVIRKGSQDLQLNAEILTVTADFHSDNKILEEDRKLQLHELNLMRLNDAIYQEILQSHFTNPFDFVYERYTLFGTAGIKVSRELKIPCVVEINSPLVKEQQNFRTLFHHQEAKQIEDAVFNGANLLAVVSDEIKKYVLSKQIDEKKVHVIPNGVDVDKFNPETRPSELIEVGGKTVIGFAGSLKPWHGLEVLMEAFRKLAQNNQHYHLLIVGDGPLRSWIEGYSCGAGMEKQVTITGWTDHNSLPGLLKLMTVAVAPYPELEDFYFSPLKLYEYMAVGKPIIASKIGQIDSIIQEGNNGMLVEPGNADALATSIRHLCHDGELRSKLGNAAAKTVMEYTWEGNANQIIALVEQENVD